MEAIIAVAAVILVGIQAHRNYLMIQAAKKPQVYPVINTPITVPAPELSIQVEPATPVVTVESLIDYDRLELIIRQVLEAQKIGTYPIPVPQYIEPPVWNPVVTEVSPTNVEEINGVEVKRFPLGR